MVPARVSRSPAMIQAEGGFKSWGTDLTLSRHIDGSSIQYRTSGYVASSSSTSALVEWVDGFGEGYIYKIRTPSNAIDINATYGKTYEFSWENEIVVPLRIPYRNIMSYKFVKSE